MTKNSAATILQEKGIKPSLQRIAIYDFLAHNRIHPTVDDVYVALKKEIPTLSRTTVYNTIQQFQKSGIVQSLGVDETSLRFDINTSPHGHFLCRKCAQVFDFTPSYAGPQQDLADGFTVFEYELSVKGICNQCNTL
ncbi:Fur family transcriptional regulator [Chitinivibrio alkaliphilus]|uniref:Ferric uptake regulation protein n=1 Tax=Chitinivibrio alkaliphilus ACht1 TaxID=1313304 RepID=U7D5Y9_9BACT|nr:Fur family transcriptional regulator [Chitinivibrio alkaliphilus]ERP31348.1 Ferric uptake regulator, Fur [Chitinivibrio alkaliphilus ACht1]